MTRRNLYEMNYARLEKLLGRPPVELLGGRSYRYRSEPYMDLVVEKLPASSEPHAEGATVLSMTHYYEMNGDLCQDPEMVLRVFPPGYRGGEMFAPSTDPRHGRVEALIFIQAIPPRFDQVYPKRGFVLPHQKKSQNSFLAQWLRNLEAQGHRLVEAPDDENETTTDLMSE